MVFILQFARFVKGAGDSFGFVSPNETVNVSNPGGEEYVCLLIGILEPVSQCAGWCRSAMRRAFSFGRIPILSKPSIPTAV